MASHSDFLGGFVQQFPVLQANEDADALIRNGRLKIDLLEASSEPTWSDADTLSGGFAGRAKLSVRASVLISRIAAVRNHISSAIQLV